MAVEQANDGIDQNIRRKGEQTATGDPEADALSLMAAMMVHLVGHAPHQRCRRDHLNGAVESEACQGNAAAASCSRQCNPGLECSPEESDNFQLTSTTSDGCSVDKASPHFCHSQDPSSIRVVRSADPVTRDLDSFRLACRTSRGRADCVWMGYLNPHALKAPLLKQRASLLFEQAEDCNGYAGDQR